jgi:N utilization substance protein B
MQTYYAFIQNKDEQIASNIWNNMLQSINQTYELYILFNMFLIEICDYAEKKIEIKKNKHLATREDLNPNYRFVENKVIEAIRKNSIIRNFSQNKSYNWKDAPQIVKNTWKKIEDADFYKAYMSSTTNDFKSDKKVLTHILLDIIPNSSEIDEYLEEKSIFCNDELELVVSAINSDITRLKKDENYILSTLFKSEEDEVFAKELITTTAKHGIKYDTIISELLEKWELSRVVFLDRIIMHLAICEILEMPNMPLTVTINEWIDIAKFYSTENSGKFVNGLLEKIYLKLKNENKISK